MRVPTVAAALLLSTLGSPLWAQSPADHSAHHPDQMEAAQPAGQPGMGGGMMGGGMMGMMGKMPMMQSTGMMREGGDCTSGVETTDHIEGRIAFLRAELKITDAQAAAWNTFADALRANAKGLIELRASMAAQQGSQSPLDRLSAREKWLASRLDGTRAIKTALTTLAGTFSDEQKKVADELLASQMGMMTGMQGDMAGMGRMPSGR